MESGPAGLGIFGARETLGRPRLEKFGRYFLLDRIATGGMAEVYQAVTHGVEGFRRTFVVKKILAEKATSPTFVRMFCDEARISALLHHPNIVQVYDFGQVGGSYFLAMEYLLGKDLSSLMRVLRAAKAAVPPNLATFIAREVALGLHYAHALRGASGQSLGIVHRDVTPSNVMLLFAGGVKVLDFGIAKVSTAAEGAAKEGGGVKGKYGYLAPEQARQGDVDARADIFALGVTLWEMLVGRRLFAGKDDLETLRNVLQKPVPPPSVLRPEVPRELDRIVLRALERGRENRYATAEEMVRDCNAVLAGAPADNQSLRVFLNDLFAEESSSLSFETPEIPEELFAAAVSAPVVAPPPEAVPRNGDSLDIQVSLSGPTGRARNPAPPFGVIASGAAEAGLRGGRRLGRRGVIVAAAVLGATLLVGLGLASRRLQPPAPVVEAAPAPALAPVAPAAPPRAPAPAPASVAEAAVVAAPAPSAAAATAAPPAERPRERSPKPRTRKRDLSADLTINPF
jgi:serine/threonine protein kinase